MARSYFYTADLYYYDPAGDAAPVRVGDYQGVYEIDYDSMTPAQVFTNLVEELKRASPPKWVLRATTTLPSSIMSPKSSRTVTGSGPFAAPPEYCNGHLLGLGPAETSAIDCLTGSLKLLT